MSYNCNSGETLEYYITLDGVGADGYSPEINIVQEDTSSFKLNLINKNNKQITPAIPKLEYLNDTFVTNDALNTTLEDYSTTVEMNTALNLKLNKDGSNATNPIALNNFKIQSVGTGTRVGSDGQLTLYGSTARPAYIPQGDTPKTLALFSDIPTIGNGIITIRQGGVTKGSFNVNQSTNNTIDLDAGGGGVSGNQINLTTEDGTRGVSLGINNTTKEAFMTYDIIGGISFDLNLISGKTAPITLTKNSDGTYGIGLDYDNDTLKVNQDGQLYADIEVPTYTAGTGIDINNKEISVDSDYIEAHKAYLADGDTLTDPEGLSDVTSYAHSTFDLSKFTIVGSPTITDDGIASGLNINNYIYYANSSEHTNFDIHLSFTKGTVGTTEDILHFNSPLQYSQIRSTAYAYPRIDWVLDDVDGVATNLIVQNTNLTVNKGDVFNIHASRRGNTYSLVVFYNGSLLGSNTVTHTVTNSNFIWDGNLLIGRTYIKAISGSIDLKQFSITVDGVEVFSGNKTGIDTIKPDNYTVTGTPTISADGVASGFSTSNYITKSNVVTFGSSGEFHIDFKFDNTSYTANQYIFNIYNSTSDSIFVRRNTSTERVECVIFVGGTTIFQENILDTSNNIQGYIEYKNGTYTLNVNGTVRTSTSAIKVNSSLTYNLSLGARLDGSSAQQPLVNGSIDLNAFKIYVDDNLVYQPCLKVPYTLSKTGSKVVNSQYRGRVQDAYNYQGYAPYYTLDETNSNFTLPMGELYGYITRLETLVSDLQTRLSALESNINGGGAGVVQQGLLGMSPLSLNRPQLLGELNPIDGLDTMDIEPTEEITQEEVELQPVENELPQEEMEEEPQEAEEEPIEETVEEQEEPKEEGGQNE